jgi:hypothetical protein
MRVVGVRVCHSLMSRWVPGATGLVTQRRFGTGSVDLRSSEALLGLCGAGGGRILDKDGKPTPVRAPAGCSGSVWFVGKDQVVRCWKIRSVGGVPSAASP